MSRENVELVRRALEALERRDLATFLAVHDQDFEVVPIPDWPEPGVRGSETAWNYYLEAFDAFERFPMEDIDVVDAGADKVLVDYRIKVSGRESGAEVEFDYWVVATVRLGRILRAQWFADRAEALEAAGLRD